jgi:hypothetical protein
MAGFVVGFGVFLVAFIVLAVFVVRFAGRLGRQTPGKPVGRTDPEGDGRPPSGN